MWKDGQEQYLKEFFPLSGSLRSDNEISSSFSRLKNPTFEIAQFWQRWKLKKINFTSILASLGCCYSQEKDLLVLQYLLMLEKYSYAPWKINWNNYLKILAKAGEFKDDQTPMEQNSFGKFNLVLFF